MRLLGLHNSSLTQYWSQNPTGSDGKMQLSLIVSEDLFLLVFVCCSFHNPIFQINQSIAGEVSHNT